MVLYTNQQLIGRFYCYANCTTSLEKKWEGFPRLGFCSHWSELQTSAFTQNFPTPTQNLVLDCDFAILSIFPQHHQKVLQRRHQQPCRTEVSIYTITFATVCTQFGTTSGYALVLVLRGLRCDHRTFSRVGKFPSGAAVTNSAAEYEAPRHGSLAFLPRKRAARHRGKVKS